MLVQVLEGMDDLHCVTLNFQLVKTLPSSEKFIHALVVAQLKQNVDVLSIFEEMLELDNVLMMD